MALGVDPPALLPRSPPGPEHLANGCGVDPAQRVAPVSKARPPPGSALEEEHQQVLLASVPDEDAAHSAELRCPVTRKLPR